MTNPAVVVEVAVFCKECSVVDDEVYDMATFLQKSVSFKSTIHKSKTRLMVYLFVSRGRVLFLTRIWERDVQIVYASAPVSVVCGRQTLGG